MSMFDPECLICCMHGYRQCSIHAPKLPKIKYEKEIDNLFESFYEDWMDEVDKKQLVSALLENSGLTYRALSDQLQAGVDVGCSVELQMTLIKEYITVVGIINE